MADRKHCGGGRLPSGPTGVLLIWLVVTIIVTITLAAAATFGRPD